jgi:1,2-phenylacetyl-CoA epoxidase PaaB subunit
VSRHWHVVLDSGEKMKLGPWKAAMQWGGNVEAPDRDAALTAAREKCRATMGDSYADGRVSEIEELHLWGVTVRGKRDKRRRETFTVYAANEHAAIRTAFYLPAVTTFAGYRSKRNDPVVKAERA